MLRKGCTPYRVVVCDRQTPNCGVPRACRSAKREHANGKTTHRSSTKCQTPEGQHAKRGTSDTDASERNTATRKEDPNSDIANGNPTHGHSAPIDATCDCPGRDVDER